MVLEKIQEWTTTLKAATKTSDNQANETAPSRPPVSKLAAL